MMISSGYGFDTSENIGNSEYYSMKLNMIYKMYLWLETKILFLLQVLLPLGELFDLYTYSGSLCVIHIQRYILVCQIHFRSS